MVLLCRHGGGLPKKPCIAPSPIDSTRSFLTSRKSQVQLLFVMDHGAPFQRLSELAAYNCALLARNDTVVRTGKELPTYQPFLGWTQQSSNVGSSPERVNTLRPHDICGQVWRPPVTVEEALALDPKGGLAVLNEGKKLRCCR